MMQQIHNKTGYHQRGLTLVELMVALVLSLMLMAGVVTVFQANKVTYRTQEGLAHLQENGRIAMAIIARDIRNGAHWGCASITPVVRNMLNVSYPFDFVNQGGIDGFDANGGSWSPGLDSSITNAISGSDVVTTRFIEGGGARVTSHTSTTADPTVSAASGLQIGDIAMVSDCDEAAIFQITGITGSALQHATSGTPGNATTDFGKKYTNGDVAVLRSRTYYVRTGAGGGPALWRIDNGTPQELVEGIEGLQILYGEDTDGDRTVDVYRTAGAVATWANVLSVRINMLVRSVEDNITDSPQTYTFNGTTTTPTDNRLRQVFAATVTIRNRAL